MKPYYVALTGSKNNAGDFLIKHRAKALLAATRPDRDLVDVDGWNPIDDTTLDSINGARALLLLGGPALQPAMVPGVYPLRPDLGDIRVPIIPFGIGWKHRRGEWRDTHAIRFAPATSALLARIRDTGGPCSVRDYHSLNVLASNGVPGALMTGCPATYDLTRTERRPAPRAPARIAFSPGVCFVHSPSLERQTRALALRLRDRYPDARIDFAFHHALDPRAFERVYPGAKRHAKHQRMLADWAVSQGFSCTDLSGSAEAMLAYYDQADLHVGYRVHAHILMTSWGKPSLLVAEDGRGRALRDTIGGMVLDAATVTRDGRLMRAANRLTRQADPYAADHRLAQDALAMLDYEAASDWQRMRGSLTLVDQNWTTMQRFLASLP